MRLQVLFAVFGLVAVALGDGKIRAATDADLLAVGEVLWSADTNRVAVAVNIQGNLPSGSTADLAPQPLFPSTPAQINTLPSYVALQVLQDNYIRNTNIDEDDTTPEDAEVDAFLDTIFGTAVLQEAYNFLTSTGEFTGTYAAFQARSKELWFTTYIRQGALSSSGFEHSFVGEMKDGNEPTGLHNWVRHLNLENTGDVNYLGYSEYVDIGSQASEITLGFELEDIAKPISGFFIGTSPEFDFAVFTICFIAKPNSLCRLNFAGITIPIQTYDIDCTISGGKCIGTAYPA